MTTPRLHKPGHREAFRKTAGTSHNAVEAILGNVHTPSDIAGYLGSNSRPQMSGLEKDYPKLEKKPADAPYPPYADNLSQERHQYGPFQAVTAPRK